MRALIALSTLAAAFRTPTHRVTARKPDKKPPQTVAPILVAASTAVPVDPAPPKRRAWLRFFADTDDAPRRSARSWITEQCARGWIRDQKKRGRLALEHVERVDAVEPEECDVSEGLSRRCPDVVRLTSSGVVWIGARPGGPKLVASRLEAELVNLHRRVLTGGRRGSLVAELTMTGADLDGSLWIRRRLDGIVRKVLVKWMGKEVCVADDALDFTTTIDAGGRARRRHGARAPRADALERYASGDGGYRESNFRFAVSFVLEADRGAILFRDPVVSLPDRPSFEAPPQWLWASQPTYALALAHTTTPLVEGGAALFLSSVTVDPTASFSITSLVPSAATPGALVATVESGPQKFSRSRLFRRGRRRSRRSRTRASRPRRGPASRPAARLEQRRAPAPPPLPKAPRRAQSSYAAAGALPKAAVAAAQTGSPPGRRRLPPSATPGREAALRRGGAAVAVPEFLAALLDLADCAFTKLFLARPECFLFCSDFLVMPNPGYVDVAALAAGLAPRDFARAAERSRRGFGLVACRLARRGAPAAAAAAAAAARAAAAAARWRAVAAADGRRAAAPPLTPPSPPRDASSSKAPAITVGALLAAAGDAAPYLYDDSDLRAAHAPGLHALEAAVADHVRAVYGHAAARTLGPDDVYFHRQRAMSAPERSWSMTAHVHVAVGRARPPACHCHSVSLRAVVARLEAPGETDEPRPPRLELLNLPADAADLARARRRLADAGFRLSRCLSPADLSFDDLAAYEP
ncbi:hypothetical protein JL721_1153 [Aureococcus anophagefferens]|nr:hypothetical protein JL721_1153 [Aureococcus anophagefferens]